MQEKGQKNGNHFLQIVGKKAIYDFRAKKPEKSPRFRGLSGLYHLKKNARYYSGINTRRKLPHFFAPIGNFPILSTSKKREEKPCKMQGFLRFQNTLCRPPGCSLLRGGRRPTTADANDGRTANRILSEWERQATAGGRQPKPGCSREAGSRALWRSLRLRRIGGTARAKGRAGVSVGPTGGVGACGAHTGL